MAQTDREALAALYHATGGPSWKNSTGWDTDADLSDWHGVKTNGQGRVVELDLRRHNLQGRIPEELGKLTALQKLVLYDNQLSGTIPEALGELTALEELHLYNNNLSGTIPRELGNLRELQKLWLSNNHLTGTIPEELGKLTAVEELYLGGNNLSGSIPPELGKLAALQGLSLSDNQLTGPIPKELGGLSKLEQLWLQGNGLTGTIPEALGELTALEELHLYNNNLSGLIPAELGNLAALEKLDLSVNKLSGPIPPQLGQLGTLEFLNLAGNKLDGNIPPQLGQLGALEFLNLANNKLDGPIPPELGNLRELRTLRLYTNQLTGNIPPELGKLTALTRLYLWSNQLTGSIPKELGDLTTLMQLCLFSNRLTGLGETDDALRLVNKFIGSGDLKLSDNPWVMPPEGVVEKGLRAVRLFLEDVQTAKEAGADVVSLKLLKVVLVGSAAAGKTSLRRSIVAGCGDPTEGTSAKVSTVGLDLVTHILEDNTTVEIYDCAGQLDYTGMHQIFLSRRALYLVVWDIEKCRDVDDEEAIQEHIMRWLYTLHLRAPGSTVMLVANKCDRSINEHAEIAASVEARARELLQEWQDRRGFDGRSTGRVTDVTLLAGPSCVSCLKGACPGASGLDALIGRISPPTNTSIQGPASIQVSSIQVPPVWDMALKVIDALRSGNDPLQAVRRHLQLAPSAPSMIGGQGKMTDVFITNTRLESLWKAILKSVQDEVEAGQAASVSNSGTALEGALWISEFAGQLLRIDSGNIIFLDVTWLSRVLKPILSHKLGDEIFPTAHLNRRKDALVGKGVLHWDFAQHLWRGIVGSPATAKVDIREALIRVLLELGIALPLGPSRPPARTRHTSGAPSDDDGHQDLLVIMRLDEMCSDTQQRRLDALVNGAWHGVRRVTLKWQFDSAGAPAGLVERLIASCRVLGEVEPGLCWRYGAVFRSHSFAKQYPTGRLYRFFIRYDRPAREMTLGMFGPLKSPRMWAAVRYVASVILNLSSTSEWPGVRLKGWPECEVHPRDRIYLVTLSEARLGDPLIPVSSEGCDCYRVAHGVLAQSKTRLGNFVDTTQGNDPFNGLPEEVETACGLCCRGAFGLWKREYAGKTARALWGLAVIAVTAGTVVGFVEDEEIVWKTSLVVTAVLLLGALVAFIVACRNRLRQGGHGLAEAQPPVWC